MGRWHLPGVNYFQLAAIRCKLVRWPIVGRSEFWAKYDIWWTGSRNIYLYGFHESNPTLQCFAIICHVDIWLLSLAFLFASRTCSADTNHSCRCNWKKREQTVSAPCFSRVVDFDFSINSSSSSTHFSTSLHNRLAVTAHFVDSIALMLRFSIECVHKFFVWLCMPATVDLDLLSFSANELRQQPEHWVSISVHCVRRSLSAILCQINCISHRATTVNNKHFAESVTATDCCCD